MERENPQFTFSPSFLIHGVGLVFGIETWQQLITQRVLINLNLNLTKALQHLSLKLYCALWGNIKNAFMRNDLRFTQREQYDYRAHNHYTKVDFFTDFHSSSP
jgi:hypothetical protein